jgi:hypothetical protein
MQVTLNGKAPFNGVLLFTRASDNSHVGEFAVPGGLKANTAKCTQFDDHPNSTLTHANPTPKQVPMTFMWKPPNNAKGNLEMCAVVVGSSQTTWQVLARMPLSMGAGAAGAGGAGGAAGAAGAAANATGAGDAGNATATAGGSTSTQAASTAQSANSTSTGAAPASGTNSTAGSSAAASTSDASRHLQWHRLGVSVAVAAILSALFI